MNHEDPDEKFENEKKTVDSMAGIREKQRKLFNEEIKKTRRDILLNKRFDTFHLVSGRTPQATVEFSLSHLADMPNSEMLKSKIIEWSNSPIQPDLLYTFLSSIESTDVLQQHYGLIGLRRILSQQTSLPIQQVMDHPCFFKILKLARGENQPHLQLESTWCLANMASGTTDQTNSLIQKNVLDVFNDLAQSKYTQIAEQAIWGLGNIAGDCVEFRNKIMKSNVIETLLNRFETNQDPKITSLITWVFSNVCRLRPSSERISPLLKRMLLVLRRVFALANDADLKNECLFGFYSNAKAESAELFDDREFLAALVRYYVEVQTQHTTRMHQLSALHTFLGGITSAENKYGLLISQCGFLPLLKNTLSIQSTTTAREVCWILSNLAIGETVQVRAILNEPMLLETIAKFTQHSDLHLAREANWMICNLCLTKDEDTIRLLLEKGVLRVFKMSLDADMDQKITTLVLEALIHLLDYFKENCQSGKVDQFVMLLMSEGLGESMEGLQFHESDMIYLKAHMLLDSYFPLEI